MAGYRFSLYQLVIIRLWYYKENAAAVLLPLQLVG
jgi:hypothetical protein